VDSACTAKGGMPGSILGHVISQTEKTMFMVGCNEKFKHTVLLLIWLQSLNKHQHGPWLKQVEIGTTGYLFHSKRLV